MLRAEALHFFWRELIQHGLPDAVAFLSACTINTFKHIKQDEQFLDVFQRELFVDAVGGMRDRTGNVFLPQIIAQIVNVVAGALNHGELFRRDVITEDVNLAAIFGEISCGLCADKTVVRMESAEFTGSLNRVVIRNGDKAIALLLGEAIDRFDGGVTFACAETLEDPFAGVFRVVRMNVEISLGDQSLNRTYFSHADSQRDSR